MSPEIGLEKINSQFLSLSDLEREENLRVESEVLIEREWWGNRVFETSEEAIKGGLVRAPDEGNGYRLIGQLIRGEEPKLILPEALKLLEEVSSRWKVNCEALKVEAADTFLSVTSLYRDFALQELLRKKTYLATSGISGHSAGAVFDFDPNGYYIGKNRSSVRSSFLNFNPVYIRALTETLEEFVGEEKCHVIYELGFRGEQWDYYRYNKCYHVCLNPNSVHKL